MNKKKIRNGIVLFLVAGLIAGGVYRLRRRENASEGVMKLYAPSAGVIQDRIMEPGDMALPTTPVFTLALDRPMWVRAYVPEPSLGKIIPGMKAQITTDSFSGKIYI
jgi:hypothetical protein